MNGIEAVKDDSFKNNNDLANKDLTCPIFDLSGRRMEMKHNGSFLQTFPEGVYVIKGWKIIVR